jgi:hypothetical protein
VKYSATQNKLYRNSEPTVVSSVGENRDLQEKQIKSSNSDWKMNLTRQTI